MMSVGKGCRQVPVFRRNKRSYFSLFIDDYAKSDRLNAPRRQTVLNSLAKKGAELITDEPVQNSSRLLRIDEVIVDFSRIFQSLFNGFFADFVEFYPLSLVFKP